MPYSDPRFRKIRRCVAERMCTCVGYACRTLEKKWESGKLMNDYFCMCYVCIFFCLDSLGVRTLARWQKTLCTSAWYTCHSFRKFRNFWTLISPTVWNFNGGDYDLAMYIMSEDCLWHIGKSKIISKLQLLHCIDRSAKPSWADSNDWRH